MKYFELCPEDPSLREWVLYHIDPSDGVLKVRSEYADLKCPSCGKVDEIAALRRGVVPGIRIRSKRDYVGTCDDLICVGRRLADIIKAEQISGAELIPIPRSEFSVLIPTIVASTDETTSGMDLIKKCGVCGRYKSATGGPPPLESMSLPTIGKCFFRLSIASESLRGVMLDPCADEIAVRVLKREAVRGICYVSLGEL